MSPITDSGAETTVTISQVSTTPPAETPASEPYYRDTSLTLWHGDALEVLRTLPTASVDCCVTSAPYYGVRNYGVDGTEWPQAEFTPIAGMPAVAVPAMACPLGLEPDPTAFVAHLHLIFAEVRRVLTDDGTLWLNLGDSYATSGGHTDAGESSMLQGRQVQPEQARGLRRRAAGIAAKNLLGIPWRVALAMQADGSWIVRNAIIWNKPNAMPESVTDRLSCRHEYLFLLAKSRRYWFDLTAIREPVARPDASGKDTAVGGKREGEGQIGSSYRIADGVARAHGQRHRETDYRVDRDHAAENAGGRNPGDVWTLATRPFAEAHFATFPEELARRAVAAGCPERRCTACGHTPTRLTDIEYAKRAMHDAGSGAELPPINAVRTSAGWTDCGCGAYRAGRVLDPFSGSGTTGLAAARVGRHYIGIDLNREYLDLSLRTRLAQSALPTEDLA